MEAVAAIGLAANILQFIDFGTRILSKGKEIYTSTDGTLKENITIEAVVNHLKDSLARLQGYTAVRSVAAQKLQDECGTLINEILNALDKVKVKGPPSKWKSLRKALKSVRSKGQIEQWLRQLESLRNEYNTELEVEILTTIDLRSVEQSQSFQDLEASQKALAQTLLDAIREGEDNFEAVSRKHAIEIRALIQKEHESSRAHVTKEATMTRNSSKIEHEETRTQLIVQSTTTRQLIEQRSSEQVAIITERIEQTSDTQIKTQRNDLDAVRRDIESAISLEVNDVTQILSTEMALQSFTTGLQILDGDKSVIDSLSQGLAHTTLELREMQARQAQQAIARVSPWQASHAERPLAVPRGEQHVSEDQCTTIAERQNSPLSLTTNTLLPVDLGNTTYIDSRPNSMPTDSTLGIRIFGNGRIQRGLIDLEDPDRTSSEVETTEVVSLHNQSSPDPIDVRLLAIEKGQQYTVLRTQKDYLEYFVPGRIFDIRRRETCNVEAFKQKFSAGTIYSVNEISSTETQATVRLLVIQARQFSCLCVNITTYYGRGLRSVEYEGQEAVNAHATVHLKGAAPNTESRNEPILARPPVVVHVNRNAPPLEASACIDFRRSFYFDYKPHVLHVGNVDRDSIHGFLESAREYGAFDALVARTDRTHQKMVDFVEQHSSDMLRKDKRGWFYDPRSSYYIYLCSHYWSTGFEWPEFKAKVQARYECLPGGKEESLFVLIVAPAQHSLQRLAALAHEYRRAVRACTVLGMTWEGMLQWYDWMPDVNDIKAVEPSQ